MTSQTTLRSILLAVLFFVFALGSWIGINGIFCELQVLMTKLPEGNALGSLISLAVQCSNAFLILYLVLAVFVFPDFVRTREIVFVLLVFGVEAAGLVLLSFLYDSTLILNSAPHSVALLALTVLIGGANVVSSPVFLPIMSQYPQSFSSVFAAGEAASSLVAAVIAFIQFEAGFSVSSFFVTLVVLVGLSATAYLLLFFLPASRELREATRSKQDLSVQSGETETLVERAPVSSLLRSRHVLQALFWELLVTVALNWMESGALNAVLSYCLRGYGDAFYAAGLWGGMVAAPVGSMASLIALVGQPWHWSLIWIPAGIFLVVNSLTHILLSSTAFGVFVVGVVIVCRLTMGYCKALIYVRVQQKGEKDGLFVVAIAQQVGAFVGSLVFFLLINYSPWYF
jgi:hypothetical protein